MEECVDAFENSNKREIKELLKLFSLMHIGANFAALDNHK